MIYNIKRGLATWPLRAIGLAASASPGARCPGQTSPPDPRCHRPPGEAPAAASARRSPPPEKMMDLVAFHYDRSFVLDALRHGDVDYLEHVSEAAEADLFRHLMRRQVV